MRPVTPVIPVGISAAPSPQVELANVVANVHIAATILSADHYIAPSRPRGQVVKAGQGTLWGHKILNTAAERLYEIKAVTARPGSSPPKPTDKVAFVQLASLAPAMAQEGLLVLHDQNRPQAWQELVRQVELLLQQIAATLDVALEANPVAAKANPKAALDRLLKNAGGALTVTEAARKLGITRQALHKKVHLGNALGMMLGDVIVLPKIQFDRRAGVLPGIDTVAKPFLETGAGPYSALQFLVEVDPNLGQRPIDALKEGKVEAVSQAARAYLSMDEG
jgi:hypothetical protein